MRTDIFSPELNVQVEKDYNESIAKLNADIQHALLFMRKPEMEELLYKHIPIVLRNHMKDEDIDHLVLKKEPQDK